MTLPYGVISDPHYHRWDAFATTNADGLNSRLEIQLDATKKAAKAMKAAGCKHMLVAGDTFHVRGAIRAVFESVQGLVGEEVGEAINAAMSQFNGGTKRSLFPMHLKLSGGTVLYVSVCLETNQIQLLNTSTGEWREPVVCESGEDALKKAAQFVRGALLKGAKKL
ncbi:hypothetical protein B7K56_24060 [Escherichia coli]|nr:hypothetical protein [Escherichia coli]